MADKNPKPLWTYIKHQRNDSAEVHSLKEIGSSDLVTDCRHKAEVLNQQLKSVFMTTEFQKPLKLNGDKKPSISDIQVEVDGIGKLLGGTATK